MTKRYIQHLIVTAFGFLMGAAIAMTVAPGNTLLLIGGGIVFAISARALFDRNFGGEWFWPSGKRLSGKTLVVRLGRHHR